MNKITPFLRFDGKAEEAMNFYTPILKIQRSRASCVMEKQGQDRRDR
jgi:predicted 3-demethylubiquinone-9 3-methyltransferase (glyoxalase superfamily)